MGESATAVEFFVFIFAKEQDSPNERPRYNTKQSDVEAPVMLELWRRRTTPSKTSFPGPLWPGELTHDKFQ